MICVLAVLSLFTLSVLLERYEETVDTGWSQAAKRNPYLALQQFGNRMEIDTLSSTSYEQLDRLEGTGTLFISKAGAVLSQQRIDEVIEWIRQGGSLIIAAPVHDEDAPDPLLSRFNVEAHYNTFEDDEDQDEEPRLSDELEEQNMRSRQSGTPDDGTSEIPIDQITLLEFTNPDVDVSVFFDTRLSLHHPYLSGEQDESSDEPTPIFWGGDTNGINIMQFDVGEGLLTVLTDNSIWRSDRIDSLDHALLFLMMADAESRAIILYGAEMPSIFLLLWKHAPEFIIVSTLWLASWLAFRSRRFGPISDRAALTRRSMSEHIHASADYQFKRGHVTEMVERARIETHRKLLRHFPAYDNMNDSGRMLLIGEHTGLEESVIVSAMFAEPEPSLQNFTKIIRDIQSIDSSL